MIGQKSFEIDATDLIKGMSSSDFINDGGFSNRSYGVNPTKTPGLLYSAAQSVDQTDDLTDDLIASCEDGTVGTAAVDRIFVDNAGKYYDWDGTLLDLIATDGGTPNGGYSKGNSDMISFGITSARANIFTTNGQYITRLELSSNTLTNTFKQFTYNSSAANLFAPHPALVYENNAYYGDGRYLLRQTSPTDSTMSQILTLPEEQIIVALGQDPGSGRMLISTVDGPNMSDTKNRIARVLYYDGFSNKVIKTVIVDNMITAFYPMGGTLYITYGQNFGYWTGSGIQFLRALDVDLNSTKLAYKQNITNIGTVLYLIEGAKILAYDEIIRGQPKVFWYPYENQESGTATDMSVLCNLGSGVLGFGWVNASAVEKFSTLNTTSISNTGNNVFYTNKYTFPRPVTFNGALVEYGSAMASDSTSVGLFAVIDDKQQTTFIPSDISGVVNEITNNYTAELTNPTIQTRSLQFRYNFVDVTPIRRITVFYTPKE